MHLAPSILLVGAALAAPTAPRTRLSKMVARRPAVAAKASESVISGGGTAPFGQYWDPLKLSSTAEQNTVKLYREAELTHGRVCMLGALGFLVQEKFHPLFGGDIDGPAIKHFEKICDKAPDFWYPVLLSIAVAEIGRARLGWVDPADTPYPFNLREGYEPGNLGFDPLGLYPKDAAGQLNLRNKELNNGRLAMLATAGFVAQELINGKGIVDNLTSK
mmetsp:Transcript_20960/g.40615  ORF Transcript_20960/g.40615 Transcript_20960/m.40615 type:complete len:218 (+) Transcript_20960:107-760(+)|eukprot:CAMPEP_0167792508 /NCGR_PEP_ID=MMETSP0111_2-20121227/12601_1 /TAXON_ID=91324 /ORGANISM="Lotharella globosa, Strain CCCM811" /LENGTH=217 /DNA_ID=CAMNT_0007685437 /DNA_START=84 /DNA_END=737 /DNA_ORIENTATION=+